MSARLRSLLLAVVLAGGMAAVMSAVSAQPPGRQQQSPPGVPAAPPPASVASLAQLRPTTMAEQRRAAFWDWEGPPIAESKHVYVPAPEFPPPVVRPGSPPPPVDAALREAVCESQAIALGMATSSKVLLNKGETFLFTDWRFAVEKWIRPPSGPTEMTVSHMGGRVRVGTELFEATRGPVLVANRRYIVFAGEVPNKSGYFLADEPIAVVGDRVVAMPLPTTLRDTRLLSAVVDELVRLANLCKGAA